MLLVFHKELQETLREECKAPCQKPLKKDFFHAPYHYSLTYNSLSILGLHIYVKWNWLQIPLHFIFILYTITSIYIIDFNMEDNVTFHVN